MRARCAAQDTRPLHPAVADSIYSGAQCLSCSSYSSKNPPGLASAIYLVCRVGFRGFVGVVVRSAPWQDGAQVDQGIETEEDSKKRDGNHRHSSHEGPVAEL